VGPEEGRGEPMNDHLNPTSSVEKRAFTDLFGRKSDERHGLWSRGILQGVPTCSIVIPVYNQQAYTEKCLRSVARCASRAIPFEVVVVNNASTDGTDLLLRDAAKRYEFLRVVHLDRNYGFGGACNRGAHKAQGDLLVFLNNDTVVLPGWLEALVRAYKSEEDVGIVGAKLIYSDRTIQHAGISFRWIESDGILQLWPFHPWRGARSDAPQVNEQKEVDAVTGACLLIEKHLFQLVGGFDESYFMYFEDIDLNFKVRSLGKRIIYCPESTIVHFEGKSSANKYEVHRLNAESHKKFYVMWADKLHAMVGAGQVVRPLTSPQGTQAEKYHNSSLAESLRGIRWQGQVLNFSGYASHGRRVIKALKQTGISLSVHAVASDKLFVRHLSTHEITGWRKLFAQQVKTGAYLCFSVPTFEDRTDVFAALRAANPGFKAYIGLTTFETDRLPSGWAEACNRMDEVWVPSTFNQETFARAGVDADRIRVFPTGIETETFDRARVSPLFIANRRGFAFLSIFQWTKRKGWDVLLRAYLSAFTPDDDVCLILRTYPYKIKNPPIKNRIEQYIHNLGFQPQRVPPIILLDKFIPEALMPSLYAAADAFVLPSRGEGFGLPYMEAMAMGLPTIATRWGGHLDFMNDSNSFLIDVESLRPVDHELTWESVFYTPDQRLAEPCVNHTAELMRLVFENRAEAERRGRAAGKHIRTHWNMERSARWFQSELSWILS